MRRSRKKRRLPRSPKEEARKLIRQQCAGCGLMVEEVRPGHLWDVPPRSWERLNGSLLCRLCAKLRTLQAELQALPLSAPQRSTLEGAIKELEKRLHSRCKPGPLTATLGDLLAAKGVG